MSSINVDNIVNRSDDAAPSLIGGANIPGNVEFKVTGGINYSGVSTIGSIKAVGTNVSGILTASSFIGNGSGITNLPVVSEPKAIALRNLLDVLPYRA